MQIKKIELHRSGGLELSYLLVSQKGLEPLIQHPGNDPAFALKRTKYILKLGDIRSVLNGLKTFR